MNVLFENSRVPLALLILDSACLWYYIAGGRLGHSLLLLAGLASLGLLPPRYSAGVLARHKWLMSSAVILSALTYALSPSIEEARFTTLMVQVIFALGFGAVSGFLAAILARREWVFLAVVALAVALVGWALLFATIIMPQNDVVMGAAGGAVVETEVVFGVFFAGNNYYTLTYYLLVPVATASLVFGEGFTRKSLVLLLAGLVGIVLALIFGRRGPILAGVITWVFVAICARRPGRSLLRAVFAAGGVLVCLGGGFAWLFSQEWGRDVLQEYLNRSDLLLEDPRVMLWENAVQCIIQNPFGGGRELFRGASQYAHNVLLDAGLDLGVAGLLVYALLLGQIAWRVVSRILRRDQPLDRLEICLFAIILAHLVQMMAEPLLPERLIVLIWAGVTLSCVSEAGAKGLPKRTKPSFHP